MCLTTVGRLDAAACAGRRVTRLVSGLYTVFLKTVGRLDAAVCAGRRVTRLVVTVCLDRRFSLCAAEAAATACACVWLAQNFALDDFEALHCLSPQVCAAHSEDLGRGTLVHRPVVVFWTQWPMVCLLLLGALVTFAAFAPFARPPTHGFARCCTCCTGGTLSCDAFEMRLPSTPAPPPAARAVHFALLGVATLLSVLATCQNLPVFKERYLFMSS